MISQSSSQFPANTDLGLDSPADWSHAHSWHLGRSCSPCCNSNMICSMRIQRAVCAFIKPYSSITTLQNCTTALSLARSLSALSAASCYMHRHRSDAWFSQRDGMLPHMLEQSAALKPRRAGQLPPERAQLHILYWDDRGFCTTGDSAHYVCKYLQRSIAVLHCGISRTESLLLAFGAERLTCFAISVMSSWPCPCVFSTLPQHRVGQSCYLPAPRPHRSLSGRLTHTRGYGRQNFMHGEDEGRGGVHLASPQVCSAASSLGVQEASDASVPSERELAGGVREGEIPRRPWACLGLQRCTCCDG